MTGVAIVGAAETTEMGKLPGISQLQLHADAALNAFADTGLTAKDIDGDMVDFETLRGQVTVLTNVASYCGYTESHYRSLVELYGATANRGVTILAFPCNQFGKQEPGTADEIKAFAAGKGVQFKMMEKIEVNGADTHLGE